MTISELRLKSSAEIDEPVRRFEVFTDTGRHRDWSGRGQGADRGGELRDWRDGEPRGPPPCLVAAAVVHLASQGPQGSGSDPSVRASGGRAGSCRCAGADGAVVTPEAAHSAAPRGAIELDVAGAKVAIENGASPATIAVLLGALKAGS